ncbi:hypothetical protein [Spartinivicinus poritis]|uniref:Uncharacterized protein n=1 Tax=Spartinivicinus poritis TaxID=2994640 RepID=A0ABT5U6Z1_9GAMM|nr:hypothetical protein [Spartinivicinus sp. A2-2]MDE1462131.1 hypothetical protein [Spartinivicinus sp. A2-2]
MSIQLKQLSVQACVKNPTHSPSTTTEQTNSQPQINTVGIDLTEERLLALLQAIDDRKRW